MLRQVERLIIMGIACLPLTGIPAEDPPPDPDFLEYLGLMAEEDGEYLDLMDLAATGDELLPGAQPAAPVDRGQPEHTAAEAPR